MGVITGIFLIGIPLIIFFLSSSRSSLNTSTHQTIYSSPTPTRIPEKYIYQQQTSKASGHIITIDPESLETPHTTEQLNDGTTKYTLQSTNPNRPDIIIAKGHTIIFMRQTAVGGKEVNDGYKNLFGKQSQTLPGPTFYGKNTVIYYYENGGTALTVDPKTQTTYEEFTLQPPISVDEFKLKYRQYAN